MDFITHSAIETEELGAKLGKIISSGDDLYFVAMYGDLGAGKTAFVRGLALVMSPGSRVKSPTYTLVNEYRRGKTPLFHFDLYRISDADELYGMGFDEYLRNGNCVAEWSENLGEDVPENSIIVKIEKLGETERRITIDGIEI